MPAAGGRPSRQLVRAAGAARRARRPPADPPRRLSLPQGRGGGAGEAAGPAAGRCRRRDADGGGLARALAGLPHLAGRFHRPRVHRARAPVPGSVPGAGAAGGAVRRARAGHVHRDHPPAPGIRVPGLGRDAEPDPGHAAGGAERGGPPRADHRQPGRPGRAPARSPAPGRGVDACPGRALAAHRRTTGCGGVDRRADRAVPARDRGSPAVCRLPPDRAARPAPRRRQPGCAGATWTWTARWR
jgi:hypothetical protein